METTFTPREDPGNRPPRLLPQFQLVEQQKRQHEHDRMREMERQRLKKQERLAEIKGTRIKRQKTEEEHRVLEEDQRMKNAKSVAGRRRNAVSKTTNDIGSSEVAAIREAERREHQRQQAEIQLQRKQHEELQQRRL
ncbi:hypothetical protein DFP72DRAFT_1079478 [Ephemerocybe angulata]|uniref:Uncharacterized protein n=1 Tax=Ephemerocybe angulata TaxID=980116 RepID=A0A8H6LX28_9AGAR|nr:hypothetical protein DFP72DRAFT_1079478 [Tulosesus angulatus]